MILVATGLRREAQLLAGPDLIIVAGGGDRERLAAALEAEAANASGIISIGLGGALTEDLKPGDWIVAREIVSAHTPVIATDAAWSARLLAALPGARSESLLGSDTIVADAKAKREAHAETGAAVVDMESHIAAEVAARHGLPFAAARVISDAADRSLPKAAQAGMAADGSMDIGAVLRALAASPWQLPALIRVGSEAGTAFKALGRARDLLGPGLGGLDLGQLPLDVA
jgi:adenosylhomocysteine nucleosidase